jgi:hypothetical protein
MAKEAIEVQKSIAKVAMEMERCQKYFTNLASDGINFCKCAKI